MRMKCAIVHTNMSDGGGKPAIINEAKVSEETYGIFLVVYYQCNVVTSPRFPSWFGGSKRSILVVAAVFLVCDVIVCFLENTFACTIFTLVVGALHYPNANYGFLFIMHMVFKCQRILYTTLTYPSGINY